MKAIIVGGGLSTRLLPLTKDLPKTLLKVDGKPILGWELRALKEGGIKEVVFVSGYKGQKVKNLYPDLKFYDDFEFQTKISILRGLFCAEKEMTDGFIFSYADIIYTKETVRKLMKARGSISLVVDTNWREGYIGRKNHPPAEAELVKTDANKVVKIGKDVVGPEEAHGEFIGLAKFTKRGSRILIDEYRRLCRKYRARKGRQFQNAGEFHKAYLTDMIQELIDRGHRVSTVDIKNRHWSEVDTEEDLRRAERKWKRRWK